MKSFIHTVKKNLMWISYIISCCCILIYFIYMCTLGNVVRFAGESDDYMLLAIALEKNFSDLITPDVIEQAKIDYPDLAGSPWEQGLYHLPITINDVSYSWYFITYPLLCLPIKFLLKLFGVHQIYAFYLTNLFLLLASVAFSLWWLKDKICCKILYAPLLLITVNLPYMFWASNEICLMSFLILACSALFSNRYVLSAFFSGIAATLNIASFIFVPFLYLSYFYRNSIFLSFKISVLRQCVIDLFIDYKRTILMMLGSFIGFIPVAINLYRWNRVVMMQGMGNTDGIFERFLAYLFDLNFGILPYYPFVLLLFFGLLLTFKRDYFFYVITVCGIILSFSIMIHINCGMEHMARYLSWIMPLILIGIFYYTRKYLHNFYLLNTLKFLFFLSMIYSIGISIVYIPTNQHYCEFRSISKRIISFYPALYNPLFSTFNSRVNHYDGAYDFYNYLPIEYIDKKGNIRKVLLETKQIENYIDTKIIYSPKKEKYIEKEKKKINNLDKKYQYINFPKGVYKKNFP